MPAQAGWSSAAWTSGSDAPQRRAGEAGLVGTVTQVALDGGVDVSSPSPNAVDTRASCSLVASVARARQVGRRRCRSPRRRRRRSRFPPLRRRAARRRLQQASCAAQNALARVAARSCGSVGTRRGWLSCRRRPRQARRSAGRSADPMKKGRFPMGAMNNTTARRGARDMHRVASPARRVASCLGRAADL